MILPHSNGSVFVILLLSMICLGSWVNLYKLAGKWRYELFYFDFAFGLGVTALICAFTVGSLGYDGFSFMDDMMNAGKRQWMFGFLAAIIFNLGNMLLLAATSVAGITVAFPMAAGVALIVSAIRGFITGANGQGSSSGMILGGCALLLLSIFLNLMAYSRANYLKHEAAARAGKASTRRPSPAKGILLCLFAGLILGLYSPLLGRAQDPDIGLGPYAISVIFALAVGFSTFVFNLFLMNLPVEGDPLEIVDYFRGTVGKHIIGFFGGVLFALGLVMAFIATTPKGETHLDDPAMSLFTLGAPALAGLWGLGIWKEYRDSGSRALVFTFGGLILFVVAVGAFSVAPTLVRK